MLMNALFMLIQLILVAVTAGDCANVPQDEIAKSPFGFVCFLANQASYFAPIVILIIFAIVCAVLACLLRAALDDDDDDDNDKDGKDKKGATTTID
jgi:hypothetical protein